MINILSNHYTIYNEYLFKSLIKENDLAIKIFYLNFITPSHPVEVDRSLVSNFEEMFWSNLVVPKLLYRSIFSKDYFIIAGWNNYKYLMLIIILSMFNKPFAIFTDTPKKSNGIIHLFKNKFLKFILRENSKAKVLVTGDIGKDMFINIFDIKENIYCFPFATNNNFFRPIGVKLKEERLTLGSVGRIDFGHKGQDVALKALVDLKNSGINSFFYYIVGDGPDMIELTRLIQFYNLNDNVKVLGWKQYSELPQFYNDLDFLLHTSHTDPYPNCILESLSCGTPIIGSNKAGSVIERVINYKNGFVHDVDNSITIVDNIKNALALSPIEYEEMRKCAREYALNWGVNYNINVIRKIVNETS